MTRALLAVLIAGLVAAPAAEAGTVSSVKGVVSFNAGLAERNELQIAVLPTGAVELRDTREFSIGTGCRRSGDGMVECEGPLLALHVDLGDVGDRLNVAAGLSAPMVVLGGGGNDVIAGSGGRDVLDGGAGDDRILGRAGDDRILGAAGNDRLTGGEGDDSLDGGDGTDALAGDGDSEYAALSAGDDSLSGGEGNDLLDGDLGSDDLAGGPDFDTVSYAGRNGAVTARLDPERGDGELDEDDLVRTDVEVVLGGSGPDLLVGTDGVEAFFGNGGDDVLVGGASADTLSGGEGADRLLGDGREPGEPAATVEDDEEREADGGDTLTGGPGRDHLKGGDGADAHIAGDGDDDIDAMEPTPDAGGEVVGCGTGRDEARLDDADSSVDCEAILRLRPPAAYVTDISEAQAAAASAPKRGAGSQPPLGRPTAGGGVVQLPVLCPASTGECRISARVVLSPRRHKARGGRRALTAGRAGVVVPEGTRHVISIRLSPIAVSRIRRLRSARAVAEIVVRPRTARAARWARPFVLKRRALP